ncbi:MAG: ATP-binding protein [Pikeienuella sp.]
MSGRGASNGAARRGLGGILGRLGIVGRLVAILLLLLLALASVGIGLSYAARQTALAGAQPSVPEQIAGVVRLLDAGGPALAPAIVAGTRSSELTVVLRPKMPGPSKGARRLPRAEWLLAQHLDDPGRLVLVERPGPRGPVARWLSGNRAPRVRAAVGLADGRAAVFSISRLGLQRLLGVPVGFWIGAVGCLFAALAVWAIAREARPLRRLAASVAAFGADGAPHPVEARGAPEIRRLTHEVNAMQDRIASLIRGRTVLLGAVGHDLKTYITRLRLRIEEIEDTGRRARAEADLEAMTRLVDDALAVARGAESGRRERLDLAALVADEVAARTEARVELRCGSVALWVSADGVALRRLFSNLLDNALRFGERARGTLGRAGAEAGIVVEDDGPGIPAESRDQVFEPFVRLEASRSRETGGSGLGLAIVRQIAEAHGGAVAAGESADLGGARLAVWLPARD